MKKTGNLSNPRTATCWPTRCLAAALLGVASLAASPCPAVLLALMSATTAIHAVEPNVAPFQPPAKVPRAGLGWRYDGSGVLPDVKAPTTWNETTGENILWRAPIANWGYGCPVPVGNRVLFLSEPGWKSIWPQLTCYDADSGAIVWRVDVAAPQATAEDIAGMKAYSEMLQTAYNAMKPFLGLRQNVPGDDPRIVAANAAMAPHEVRVSGYRFEYGLLRDLRHTTKKWHDLGVALNKKGICLATVWARFGRDRVGHAFPTPVSDGTHAYVQTRHGTVACYDIATGQQKWVQVFVLKPPANSEILSSPRLWDDKLLVGFIYTSYGGDGIFAFDKATGKQLWHAPGQKRNRWKEHENKYYSRAGGSLRVMSLKNGEQSIPMIISSEGAVVRVADGFVYPVDLAPHLATAAIDEERGIVSSGGNADRDGKWAWALKLSLENADTLKVEDLYRMPIAVQGTRSASYVNGILYAAGIRLNGQTGVPVSWEGQAKPALKEGLARALQDGNWSTNNIGWSLGNFLRDFKDAPAQGHVSVIADGKVYGFAEAHRAKDSKDRPAGICQVYSLDGKKLAENTVRIPERTEEQTAKWIAQGFPLDGFNYSCPMNIGAVGDGTARIYLISNDELICVGFVSRPSPQTKE